MASPSRPRRTTAELARLNDRVPELLSPVQLRVMRDSVRELVEQGMGAQALSAGEQAPDFILPDASGQLVRLYDQLDKGPVVLVFFRGGWCAFCETYLQGLQRELFYFRELGAELMAVSPQLPDVALNLEQDKALAFPLVSDPGLKTARRYGLVYPVPKRLQRIYHELNIRLGDLNGEESAQELPLAATFVITPDRRIIRAETNEDYTQRYDPVDIIEDLVRLRDKS